MKVIREDGYSYAIYVGRNGEPRETHEYFPDGGAKYTTNYADGRVKEEIHTANGGYIESYTAPDGSKDIFMRYADGTISQLKIVGGDYKRVTEFAAGRIVTEKDQLIPSTGGLWSVSREIVTEADSYISYVEQTITKEEMLPDTFIYSIHERSGTLDETGINREERSDLIWSEGELVFGGLITFDEFFEHV